MMKSKGGKSQSKTSAKVGKAAGGDSKVAVVFDIGFLGSVLRSGYYAYGERLQEVWRCLDKLGEVIHPSVFIVLRDLLTKLTNLGAKICPYVTASIQKDTCFLSRWLRDVRAREGMSMLDGTSLPEGEIAIGVYYRAGRVRREVIKLSQKRLTRYRTWIKLSHEFQTAAWQTFRKSSTYYCWFRAGYCLGDWINVHALRSEHSSLFNPTVKAFQQSVLELPRQFLTRAPWLNRLAKYKFRENTAIELSKLVKNRVEPSGTDGEHPDYQLQLAILYDRIVEEVRDFEGAYKLPPSEVGGADDKEEWMPAKDAKDFAWELFELDLNYNEITRRSRGEERKFRTRPSKTHAQRREVHVASFVLYLRDEKRKLKLKKESATSGGEDDEDKAPAPSGDEDESSAISGGEDGEDEPSNEQIEEFLRRKGEVDKEDLRRLRDRK